MIRLAYPAYRSMSGKVKLIQGYVGSVLLIYWCESCHLRISLGRTYDKVDEFLTKPIAALLMNIHVAYCIVLISRHQFI